MKRHTEKCFEKDMLWSKGACNTYANSFTIIFKEVSFNWLLLWTLIVQNILFFTILVTVIFEKKTP